MIIVGHLVVLLGHLMIILGHLGPSYEIILAAFFLRYYYSILGIRIDREKSAISNPIFGGLYPFCVHFGVFVIFTWIFRKSLLKLKNFACAHLFSSEDKNQ